VADISCKGLLPQLTDLLHALTESHELLLSKVQSVRLGHMNVVHSASSDSPYSPFLAFVDPRPSALVDTKTGTTVNAHRASPIEEIVEIKPSMEPSRLVPCGSDVSADFVAAGAQLTHPGTPGPSAESTYVVKLRHDMDAAIPVPTSTPESPVDVRPDPMGAESEDRNYNFFDELDAKLADLEMPESGSEED